MKLAKRIFRNPYFWCVLIRMLFMVLVPRHWQGDAVDYEQLATNLANGHGFSRCFGDPYNATAQRPPLYPVILALLYMSGVSHGTGAIFLNIVFDLISMWLIRKWAETLRLSWARHAPWIIALCPLLVTYGMYPTTENISITLFLAALVVTFRKRLLLAGLLWGLLSLSRSYYLLFPFFLAAGMYFLDIGGRNWKPRTLIAMIVMSFAAPTAWMVRNYHEFGRVAFTQTSMVGWQSYQGICIANFDWWRPDHLSHMYSVPVLNRVITGHCLSENALASLDKQIMQMVQDCVVEHPANTVRNVLTKGVMLFVNWGLFMPYDRVPFMVTQLVNAFLCFFWFCVVCVLAKNWARVNAPSGLRDVVRFSAITIVYVVLVTIPFAVDARYLLGPFLTLVLAMLEITKTPGKFLQSGLGKGV